MTGPPLEPPLASFVWEESTMEVEMMSRICGDNGFDDVCVCVCVVVGGTHEKALHHSLLI